LQSKYDAVHLMSSIQSILKQYWGYDSFRPLQEKIINAVLGGKDVLALLPTGGGKSVCFQVPAMKMEGLCLVVSPLIALMKDQVEHLREKGITAFAIYSGMSRKEVILTLKTASGSNCKFLYVSPERLETRLFLEYLPALDVCLLAVDEAHCISQWGYDFRPTYLRIAALREQLPGIPVMALTASATPIVQNDICDKLQFKAHIIFRQSFERPNLSYSVFKPDSKITKLVEILTNVPGSSIVYCKSRKRTKEIAEQLQTYNIDADFYHAGLLPEQRSQKQESWISDKTRTIVSTNAFGMGIDKPGVRTVIHVDSPDCLENYYQEAGRAGRDGKKSFAVLLYQDKDLDELRQQAILRFPPIKDIRLVYQAIVNYLQIPNGAGAGNYYEFLLADFLQKFQLPSFQVMNTLKVLEHGNLITFNEQIFLSSKIMFTCNKEVLYQFERSHPVLEPVIKTLLRSYEGVFDQDVNINEKSLAYLLKKDVKEITRHLQQLHSFGILSYTPQKDTPQLYFIQNRVKAEDLLINMRLYNARKQHYKERVESMISYTKSSGCRSQLTGNYFGDDDMKPCGICDNCLKKQRSIISAEEFVLIETRILSFITEPIQARELISSLKGIHKEKLWKVIEFLQAEKKIEVNKSGLVKKFGE
jgi:ATP-dependent DNA helicase RecQ